MIAESIEKLSSALSSENPFPGLRPFELHESHLFFGREGQSEKMLKKLEATRFLAVVGTSGSGKSSLVRAGLAPALFGGMMVSAGANWRVALMRPSNDPIGNLARALSAPAVFGSDVEENAEMQAHIAEATLRHGNGDNQDQLPVLQHALMRTWDECKQQQHNHQAAPGEIDVCCYEAMVG